RAEARAAGEGEREAWKSDLALRRDGFIRDLHLQTGLWLGELSRRLLADLAGEDLGPRVVATFLERLEDLDEEALAPLRVALARDSATLIVESDFAVGEEDRKRMEGTVRRRLDPGCALVFREDPGIGLGIAMEAGGLRIGWGLEEYMGEIENRIEAAFDREAPDGGTNG
ncbi:MAG TPA: hypothetical protein VMV44_03090, partial [Rectinemataceae bacterium]|nr:hypothetical protein [Rectinemataceae bacterium]